MTTTDHSPDAAAAEPRPASSSAPTPAPAFRNRIVGYGTEKPDQLLANPRNWRVHPKAQQVALKTVLREVGWVQDVVVNKTTGFVVDGHARVGIALQNEEAEIPVKYVELTEAEEAIILASFDPISAMAGTDQGLLRGLIEDIRAMPDEPSDQLTLLLSGIAERERIAPAVAPEEFKNVGDDIDTQYACPKCAYEWSGQPKPGA